MMEVHSVRFVLFPILFFPLHYRRRMRTCQYTAFTALDRCDTLYSVHKIDAGVGSGRRRRFLDLYELRFSTTF